MSDKQKILLCGDVEGKFNALFNRVQKILTKSGPFDLLLCTGNFFGINNKEFVPYKTGQKKVPLPVYILGPNKDYQVQYYSENTFEICENVVYLGKRGLYVTSKGLRIAYLSGLSENNSIESFNYSKNDISDLYDICLKGNPGFRGVDILLVSQWPKQIVHSGNTKNIPDLMLHTSDLPSWLIMKLKPRYVVSGLVGTFYERPPFRVPKLGDQDITMEIVTRFLGLAQVDNAKKEKWLFALSLVPLSEMKISELLQRTVDETECPFDYHDLQNKIFNIQKSSTSSSYNQYIFDLTAKEDEPKTKRKKTNVQYNIDKCWFCLSSSSIEKHLIISVANHTYLSLSKNGLLEEHFVVCPIEHHQSSLVQSPEILREFELYKNALRSFYDRKGQVPVFFERNFKTSHMNLQAVPVLKKAITELKNIFLEEAEAHGFKLEILDESKSIRDVLTVGHPFFVVELPDNSTLFLKIQASMGFPIHFAEDVLDSACVLHIGDRKKWKQCTVDKNLEETLVQRIREEFAPFESQFSINE